MISLLFYVIAVVLFLIEWIGGNVSDWNLVAAGLTFFAAGHAIDKTRLP